MFSRINIFFVKHQVFLSQPWLLHIQTSSAFACFLAYLHLLGLLNFTDFKIMNLVGLRPYLHVSGWWLSDSIQRKFHQIGITFTCIWNDFLFYSHVAGYDSYSKLYANRPCIYTYPFQSYQDRLFTCVYAWRIVHWIDFFHFQRRTNILQMEKAKLCR